MATKPQNKISVGDYVRFHWGVSPAHAIVLEDRGPLGVDGSHLYRIRLSIDPYTDAMEFEMPEDQLEVIDADEFHGRPITPDEAREYLKNGGLVDILRAGISGGKNQPSAWLCRNHLGNVVHTFSPELGTTGGRSVPSHALYGNRIPRSKRDEVIHFLMSFGLTADDAEHVVAAVGFAG